MKVLAYGFEGTGKTLFALSFPDIILIDTEAGSTFYLSGEEGKNVKGVLRTQGYKKYEEALSEVARDWDKLEMQTLVTDSVTKLRQNLSDTIINVDIKRNKRNGMADAELNSNLSMRSWGKIGEISKRHQNIKIDLSNNVNIVDIAQAKEIKDDNQEFMIAPVGAKTFSDGLRMVTEIFHALKKVLKEGGYETTVGDEGGFAPGVSIKKSKKAKFGWEIKGVMTLEHALSALGEATKAAGYKFGKDIKIALDVASSEFCDKKGQDAKGGETYTFKKSTQKTLKSRQMVAYYEKLIKKFPIFSIEDGLDEADWKGWTVLTDKLGGKINLVGDDLFVTNPTIFDEGIKAGIANAILIKVNQVGSVSETLAAIKRAQVEGYAPIVSHRSGETEDTFIADLAVGTAAGQIKTGSLSRTDRVCKYNRLLRIEEELGKDAVYAGDPRQGK